MPITRQKKEQVVTEITGALKDAESAVFLNFHGLTVTEATRLRRKLRGAESTYQVIKKTLLTRALEAQGYSGAMPELSGEVAMAWSKDAVAPAREAHLFGKEHAGKLSILGGVLEGKYLSAAEALALAKMPSKEELYQKLVGTLHAVPSSFVRTLNEVPGSFVRTLSAIANK